MSSQADTVLIIGSCLEGFSFALYSGIFAVYLQNQTFNKGTNGTVTKHTLFYPICILYVLSAAIFFCDIFRVTLVLSGANNDVEVEVLHLEIISTTLVGFCDFISQSILIYRCWIVWDRQIRVVVVPLILAFSFLATWLTTDGSYFVIENKLVGVTRWGYAVFLTSLAISLTVNALVTGLIVFRIFKVHQTVKSSSYEGPASDPSHHHATMETSRIKLRPTMFTVLIESGMAMFIVQLLRVVMTIITTSSDPANLVIGVNEMLFGLTPAIVLVRVSMGLSYQDENSMIEATTNVGSTLGHSTSIPEAEIITFCKCGTLAGERN